VTCPPPINGPCEDPFISTYYAEYDSKSGVPGLSDEKECHPDQHQQWWAYNRAECRPCPGLIGRPGDYELPTYFRTTCAGWEDARSQCVAGGGDLVMVKTAEKDEAVRTYMQRFKDWNTCQGPYPWIGGKCAKGHATSSCKWIDGSDQPYQHAGFSVDDDYQHLYTGGSWGTWAGQHKTMGICETVRNPIYCVQIITDSASSYASGTLTVHIQTNSGLVQEAHGFFERVSVVLEKCYTHPIIAMEVTGHTTDAWIGSIRYSTDGGTIYNAMSCSDCTNGHSTGFMIVDGNADGNIDDGRSMCNNGNTCHIVANNY